MLMLFNQDNSISQRSGSPLAALKKSRFVGDDLTIQTWYQRENYCRCWKWPALAATAMWGLEVKHFVTFAIALLTWSSTRTKNDVNCSDNTSGPWSFVQDLRRDEIRGWWWWWWTMQL